MSYARMDHAEWLARELDRPLNPLEEKVADIIGMTFGGIYNAPINYRKAWRLYLGGRGIEIVAGCRSMATWDFDQLSRFVFLCHEARIRGEINAHTRGYWLLRFFQRQHEGGMAVRHPNLDEAVAAFRAYLPPDHRIIYRELLPAAAVQP